MIRAILVLAVMLWAIPARAESPLWSLDGGPGYMMLGAENSTGGAVISAAGRRHVPIGPLSLHLGIDATIGLGSDTHWMIGLGGIDGGAVLRLSDSWAIEGAARIEYGRIPICNSWRPIALCMRYWGWIPGAAAGVVYGGESFAIVGGVAARYIDTLAWTGLSWEPGLRGRISW